METNNQIHFHEKFEFDDFMFLDEQLQRSMQVPFETNDLTYHSPNNSLIEYPPSFFTQENYNNNDIISQTFENNNISCEADFLLWSECPPLYEDYSSTTPLPQITTTNTTAAATTTNNNNNTTTVPCTVDMDPIPNYPTFIDQNELNNSNFFLNNPNNHIDYFIDEPLNTVVVDEINMGSIQENALEGDDYNMFSKEIIKHNNNNNTYNIKNNNNNNNMRVPKIDSIHYEEIRKYFDMPISRAAKELNVGLTVLKKRCRELKIKRWPYRKIKSLESLVSNVKEMGMMEVVQILEEHKKKLHYLPGLELNEETKKLRQACFKANYKKRRASLALSTHLCCSSSRD